MEVKAEYINSFDDIGMPRFVKIFMHCEPKLGKNKARVINWSSKYIYYIQYDALEYSSQPLTSVACKVPIIPGTGPSTPLSEQLLHASALLTFGYKHL